MTYLPIAAKRLLREGREFRRSMIAYCDENMKLSELITDTARAFSRTDPDHETIYEFKDVLRNVYFNKLSQATIINKENWNFKGDCDPKVLYDKMGIQREIDKLSYSDLLDEILYAKEVKRQTEEILRLSLSSVNYLSIGLYFPENSKDTRRVAMSLFIRKINAMSESYSMYHETRNNVIDLFLDYHLDRLVEEYQRERESLDCYSEKE